MSKEKQQNQKTFHFGDRLTEEIKKKSPICVGLDPRLERIPEYIKEKHINNNKDAFKAAAESFIEFNKGIIDAVHDLVPIVKAQIAFYEQYGAEGIRAFKETVDYAHKKGVMTIADIKRGDIGSTADAYAKAFLGKVDLFDEESEGFDCDAVTVNPYMGWDTVKPFVEQAREYGKGVFVLVKTSNESSGDLQDLKLEDGSFVYEILAQYVESWGAEDNGESGYSFLGAVVGATFPEHMEALRKLMPQNIFLVPGYGAQGGKAKDVRKSFNKDGTGAIINSSRKIIFAWEHSDIFTEKDYAEAARVAVVKMKEDLIKVIS